MAVSHGSLPFKEQIDFFRGKTDLPTRAWTDAYTSEHDWAFVVAGATKLDLLADLRGAVEKSITAGGTLEQFRTDFDRVVQQHGWQYNGGRGWRTQVIWETRLRQSYNAGREAQMADPELRKRRPYGLYRYGDSAHPRATWPGMARCCRWTPPGGPAIAPRMAGAASARNTWSASATWNAKA